MKAWILSTIVSGLSYNQVEQQYVQGRISARHFTTWVRVWTWLNGRFGGHAGWLHDRFWEQHGAARYYTKINRTRAAFGLAPLLQSNKQ